MESSQGTKVETREGFHVNQDLKKAWEMVKHNKRKKKARNQVLALEREAGCWLHNLGSENWVLPSGKRKD